MKYHPGLVALGILVAIGVMLLPDPWNGIVILATIVTLIYLKFGRMSAADWFRWTHEGPYGDLTTKDQKTYDKLKETEQKKHK